MNKKVQVAKYLIFDILAAIISWVLFYLYRKVYIEPQKFGIDIPIELTSKFYLALFFGSLGLVVWGRLVTLAQQTGGPLSAGRK